jgi:predicted amidohydrolase YtcJ
VLALSGAVEQLLTYVVFIGWIFHALGAAAVIRLRYTRPAAARPFRGPGYPYTPALFVLAAAAIVGNTIKAQPMQSMVGLGMVLLGAPAHALWRRRRTPALPQRPWRPTWQTPGAGCARGGGLSPTAVADDTLWCPPLEPHAAVRETMMADRRSRREFMGLAVAGTAGALAPELLQAAQAPFTPSRTLAVDPDLVVVNARVYTMDARLPRAEAFAVHGERFVAVGSSSEMRALAGRRTRLLDAKGMTVVPGFIDTHNHPRGTTLLYDVLVGNPFEVEFVSIANIIAKLQARARETPPGTWVEGYFHDDTKLTDKRQLTRQDLDQVSTEHPVVVRHRGGHTAFYNSKAFELAKVTPGTPAPAGGTFDLDASGALSGRVTDRAMGVLAAAGQRPQFSEAERERRERDGMAHISKQFARYGLTTVHHEGGDLATLQDVRARGDLRHRVSYEATGRVLEAMITNGIRTGFGDDWIRFGATSEHTVDGSFSERTMALSTPYAGTTYTGNVTQTQPELDAWVERVHRAGIQVNCHANGDVAIDMYLTAFERAQRAFPRPDARPKITHCTLITDDLVRRMVALDAVPALFTTYAYYNSDKFPFYGEALMQRCMAYRTLLDAGIRAAAGSDFSPGPFAPLMGIQGLVTRTGWDGATWGANQRITVGEAIRVNTLHGAYAAHEEAHKGSIAAGKLADFVMLADDPHTVRADTIKDIGIVRTVVGGRTTHEA